MLKQLNYPKDSKVVDQVEDKHLKMRDSHLATYEKELREDTKIKIKEIKEIKEVRTEFLKTLMGNHTQK